MVDEIVVKGEIKVFFTEEKPSRKGSFGFGFIKQNDEAVKHLGPYAAGDVWFSVSAVEHIIAEFGENALEGLPVIFELLASVRGRAAVSIKIDREAFETDGQ